MTDPNIGTYVVYALVFVLAAIGIERLFKASTHAASNVITHTQAQINKDRADVENMLTKLHIIKAKREQEKADGPKTTTPPSAPVGGTKEN